MEIIRAFIAIPLPNSVKTSIKQFITKSQSEGFYQDIKWVNPENLHITLKFLGDTKVKDFQLLFEEINKQLSPIKKTSLQISQIGVFPKPNRARVVWIGLSPSTALDAIYETIEMTAQNLGFEQDSKAFSPHITIGRLKRHTSKQPDLSEFVSKNKTKQFGAFSINEIHFIKSQLTPKGPIYNTLYRLK